MSYEKEEHGQGLSRRRFLQSSVVGGALAAMSPLLQPAQSIYSPLQAKSFLFDEITIAGLQEGMASGRWTAHEVTKRYLARIAEIDQGGPRLNSVIELNPDALEIAESLDRERKQKGARSPLHGIPVLIKDNIDTADKMMTTAGSLALVGAKPVRDSYVAERLRAAGAVILGKTNLSEWANFRSTHSTSGWSGRGGQTRLPYALDRNPCGSSSGSGVAVAANLSAVAVGTETDGSIVCPSSANSIVGIKPTLGLVSRAGIIPIAHSQDTAGPMARTVRDAAILLGLLVGPDPRDEATAASRGKAATDYTKFLDAGALRGARIGVARETFMGYSPKTDKLVEEAIDVIKHSGATVVDPANMPSIAKIGDAELEVLLYELKADLNAYLASLGPSVPYKTLADLIRFNEQNASREMPYFGQELFEQAQAAAVPADDPAPLLDTLKFFLGDRAADPHARQAAAAAQREAATRAVLARLHDPRRDLFRRLLAPAQRFAPLREDALADVGLGWPLLRRMLLEVGRRLVAAEAFDHAGLIHQPRVDHLQRHRPLEHRVLGPVDDGHAAAAQLDQLAVAAQPRAGAGLGLGLGRGRLGRGHRVGGRRHGGERSCLLRCICAATCAYEAEHEKGDECE
jgi:amidase